MALVAYPLGWKIALAATLVLALASYHLSYERVRRTVEGDARWKRLNRLVGQAWQRAQPPSFILELRSVGDRGGLKGGSVRTST